MVEITQDYVDNNDISPDVFQVNCGSRRVLDLIADTWSMLVLYALADDTTLRYRDLHDKIEGISQKMLTQTLRQLERNGFVLRKKYMSGPPRVEYSLSELGQTIMQPLGALCEWAQDNLEEVYDAQARFDME